MKLKELVNDFLQGKGVDISLLTDDSLLMQHIQSVDFMELIVLAETALGQELDLESVQIEDISSFGGFVAWLERG